MLIEVRLFATLRRYAPSDAGGVLTLDMPEGGRVADALERLGIQAEEVHIVMVNGVSSHPDRTLLEGDRLGLFPAVGGG